MFDAPLIVGVGNTYRHDDGVGPWVAKALAKQGYETRIHFGDGTGLIDLFGKKSNIVLVDATRSGAKAGTHVQFDAISQPLPADMFHYSTHRFGLAEAVETARALGVLPKTLLVHGIEGALFAAGRGLSPSVEETAADLVQHYASRPKTRKVRDTVSDVDPSQLT